jgi:hypothetical protein
MASSLRKELNKENNLLFLPPSISAGIQPLLSSEKHFHPCVYNAII